MNCSFKSQKKKKGTIDTLISKAFEDDKRSEVVRDDPELLFCKNLASSLMLLDNKRKMMAQIEIQRVLLKHQFGTE